MVGVMSWLMIHMLGKIRLGRVKEGENENNEKNTRKSKQK